MLLKIQILLFFAECILSQIASPCPSIFIYEPKGKEADKWYGVITITTPKELKGVVLQISLDKPAELLGNWFSAASSKDNVHYTIKNQQYRLEPNHGLSIRFFVKYVIGVRGVPSLTSISLNGRVICPIEASESSATSNSHTSHLESVTPSNNNNNNNHDPSSSHGSFNAVAIDIQRKSGISLDDSCGTVKTGVRPLIIRGQATVEGEWPWHTALYSTRGANMKYICGGSLISLNHILTAGHCATKSETETPVKPNTLMAYLGKYNLNTEGTHAQRIQISKVTVHPEYNGTLYYNDLAILQLAQPAEITDYVRNVCLWEEDIKLTNILERHGTVIGWGFDQTGEITEELMMAKMPVVTTETCIFSNRNFFSRYATTKTLCAGFRNGTAACVGDSGGGMVFSKPGTNGNNIVWQIRGVVSLSVAAQSETLSCDTSAYTLYTDVAKYLDWIHATIDR